MPIRPISLLIVDNDDPVTRRVDAAAVARGYHVDYATSLAAVNTALTGGALFINELKNIGVTFLAAKLVIDGSLTVGLVVAVH